MLEETQKEHRATNVDTLKAGPLAYADASKSRRPGAKKAIG